MKPTSAHLHFHPLQLVMGDRTLEIVPTVPQGENCFLGLLNGLPVVTGQDPAPVLARLIQQARSAHTATVTKPRRTVKSDFGAVVVTMQIG